MFMAILALMIEFDGMKRECLIFVNMHFENRLNSNVCVSWKCVTDDMSDILIFIINKNSVLFCLFEVPKLKNT